MRVTKAVLERMNTQSKGLIPLPALIIITYCVLGYCLHIFWMHMITNTLFELLSTPQFLGMSLLDIITILNVLFVVYLLVSFWFFASDKSNRSIRAVSHWASYGISFALLIMMQMWIHNMSDNFRLPNELMPYTTSEYPQLPGSGGLEDMALPKTDMCRGFEKPFEDRVKVNINRKGHFILNRRDLGVVDEMLDRIRSHLSTESEKKGREPDGTSNLILLLRGDIKTEFKYIHEVMQLCGEDDIGIHRVEFACCRDLDPEAREAAKNMLTYWLPKGKLDAYVSLGEHEPSEKIKIEVFYKRKSKAGFFITVDDEKFEGAEMLKDFHSMMSDIHSSKPDLGAVVVAHDRTEYQHIIDVYAECLRAGMTGISFESASKGD